ncbi:MAG: ATP-grasp domain-containing protein [Myxococcales bacterium]|nr:ATP-grasp domain-containing protein [Myxococcales bacterium]
MFDKLLIANRGEIACRVIRTCRRLGIATVAVYSEADRTALHVGLADEAVCIGPPPVRESYLNLARIVEAARATRASAVHPGYGLLSENPSFCRAILDAGITFIGPTPEVLEAFGDKLKARAVAAKVGVLPPPGTNGPLDPDNAELVLAEAARIGYPVFVKAAAGGGGIGMQAVHKEQLLARAVASCADRGRASFGDARVYLERLIESPKHIEVQVLCDARGNTIALGDRECSLQRRHQKIIEEAPSAAAFFTGDAGPTRRRELHEAAIRIVRSVGYLGAGTVEFVASPTGELFFLEVNARLQVEHCVTEMCTGVDLVEEQLRVAAGLELSSLALSAKLRGHAIEARIYAEDPARGFVPQPGTITELVWPTASAHLRVEAGVALGTEVTPYYDPMLAKLVCHGDTREQAIARLTQALAETSLHLEGPVGRAATNIEFCREVLASAAFADASYDTHFAATLVKRKV